MKPDYEAWGTSELIERIEQLERERKNWAWIICEAWTLLEPRDDEHARNWRGYTEQHGREALEMWGKE